MPKLRMLGPLVPLIDTRTIRPPPKQALPFYVSPEWRLLVASIKQSRGNACQDPEHPSHIPRTAGRIHCDHIRELKDGGPLLDPRNIMLRCSRCHARKTMAHRAKRLKS